MTYEEFKKELYRNLQWRGKATGGQVILLEKGSILLEEDMVSLIQLVNLANLGKEDNVLREDALCVLWKQRSPQGFLHWNVRELYERFRVEGWQGIWPDIMSKIKRTANRGNDICNRLLMKPLSYQRYREELEESVYWRRGEIALALCLLVCDTGEELLTMRLNRDILRQQMGSDETILAMALMNTYAKMPPKIYFDKRIRAYRVTTYKRGNGAIALFYPGVKEHLSELVGGDYYVGFASVHEALVYPVFHNALSKLKSSIYHTGMMCEPREKLTDRIYRYSCRRKELIEV